MTDLMVRVLGPLEVSVAGCAVPLGGRKQRAVLALLALRANAAVLSDELVEVVWGDAPPSRPASVLQVYVANLRKALEPHRPAGSSGTRLLTSAGGYQLRIEQAESDLSVFDARLAAASTAAGDGQLAAARDSLHAALALWRGPPFPDLADAQVLRPELDALEERRLTALEEVLELDLALGEHAAVVARTDALIAAHPFRERLRAARVLALYRSQRQTEALEVCRETRALLLEEFGIDPGPELRALEQAVLRQDPSLQRSAVGRGPRRPARVHTLPAPLSPLIGRRRELAELSDLLRAGHVRLLTLLGPGGTGKTRVALAAARQCGDDFPDGVCWVPLDQLARPSQVLEAVGEALGMPQPGTADVRDWVTAYLASRRLLLCLDNFEHVLDAWSVVVELLAAASGLTVMVTSRTPLSVTGEQLFPVPPLELPDRRRTTSLTDVQDTEAVALFLSRARLVDHRYAVCDADAEALAGICHRLDGLPLAIELAAGHVRDLSPTALWDGLEDALGVLVNGPRDVTDRQRTLRGAIAWSYDLLPPDARAAFPPLGVFSAAPDGRAIGAVLGWPSARTSCALETLTRVSLVQRTDAAGDAARYSLLSTVRDFALERLTAADLESSRQRHAEHYLALATALIPELDGASQVEALARLREAQPEFDAALRWAASGTDGSPDAGDDEIAHRLVGVLWRYWEIVGHVVGPRELAQRVLTRSPAAPAALRAPALSSAGTLAWLNGDHDAAAHLHSTALELFQSLGDAAGIAWALVCLTAQDASRGDLPAAVRRGRAAVQTARAAGVPPRTLACALGNLGVLAYYSGDHAQAAQHYLESLAVARGSGDRWLAGRMLNNLANVLHDRGRYDEAAGYLRQALQTSAEIGDLFVTMSGVETLAKLALRRDRPRLAIQMLSAADAYRRQTAQPLVQHEQDVIDELRAQARAAVGGIGFAVLWEQGQHTTLEDARAQAIATT